MVCPKCGEPLKVQEDFDLGKWIVTCPQCGYERKYQKDHDWEKEYEMRFMRPSKIL